MGRKKKEKVDFEVNVDTLSRNAIETRNALSPVDDSSVILEEFYLNSLNKKQNLNLKNSNKKEG